VSLGTRALQPVQDAVAHAVANPGHDPVIFLVVPGEGDEEQHARWECGCMDESMLPPPD
jgi:hypothetical protein